MTPFLPFRLKASGSRRRDPIAWAALAFLLAAIAAPAQQSTNVPVATLDAVVAEALARNPELKYYEAEIAAAKAGRRSAGLRANPELSAGVGHKGVRSAGLGDEGVAWSVSVMQPFEWPGRVGLRKAIANHDVELAELGRARFQAALAARVRSLAFGLFAARERSAAAAEVVQRRS
jgi:cobalt-zinc-cadmium efflux system outer membrane protein